MSYGESVILKILKKEKISFEREKSFPDLAQGRFKYDFYLPKHKILIEFDGQQHFRRVHHFQRTERAFGKQLANDRKKNSYALANNIPLYRVPYWRIDCIKSTKDIFQDKHLVKDRWFNDKLAPP